ncbi:MAG: type II secretion system major pseudopilin GspG [Spirochaetota bacterium]|nr:type II secretion system major pseudopilin GspG [Spirochaetota bacterium]
MNNIINQIKQRIKLLISEIGSERGITLIELMIVITIIAILSIYVVPKFMDMPQKARISAAKQQISGFGLALDRYYLDNGFYPTSEQGLDALVNPPNTEPAPMNYNKGGYMKKKEIPKDPWGRDYIYISPGESGNDYEILSYGADGQEGGEDYNEDIKSWE